MNSMKVHLWNDFHLHVTGSWIWTEYIETKVWRKLRSFPRSIRTWGLPNKRNRGKIKEIEEMWERFKQYLTYSCGDSWHSPPCTSRLGASSPFHSLDEQAWGFLAFPSLPFPSLPSPSIPFPSLPSPNIVSKVGLKLYNASAFSSISSSCFAAWCLVVLLFINIIFVKNSYSAPHPKNGDRIYTAQEGVSIYTRRVNFSPLRGDGLAGHPRGALVLNSPPRWLSHCLFARWWTIIGRVTQIYHWGTPCVTHKV